MAELDANAFALRMPCHDCPFRKDGGVRHSKEMMASYASYFLTWPGATFPCHNSVPADDDRTKWSPWREGQAVCAGGLLLAQKQHFTNVIVLMAAAAGFYNAVDVDVCDVVFDSVTEMVNAGG